MPYGSNPLDPRNPYYQAACLRHMERVNMAECFETCEPPAHHILCPRLHEEVEAFRRPKEDHQQERAVPRNYGNRISNSAELHPQEIDLVQHPPHYKAGGLEAIDVIEAFAGGNFHRGNALKYLLRAGRKDVTVQDLRKAIWYIEREISNAIDTARRS